MTDTLQQQAKALGVPTRHAIFRYIADANADVDVAELTAHFGFNHNAIRQHLSQLVDADLVLESTAPAAGRGRPRLIYRLSPSADSRWGVPGPYERLSWLLTEIVRTGDSPVDVGRRAIERLQLERTAAGRDPVEVLVGQMEQLGFAPSVERHADTVDIELRACPFASAARLDPAVVCTLHLGMAYGIAEAVDGLVIDELDNRDPSEGTCRLTCHLAG